MAKVDILTIQSDEGGTNGFPLKAHRNRKANSCDAGMCVTVSECVCVCVSGFTACVNVCCTSVCTYMFVSTDPCMHTLVLHYLLNSDVGIPICDLMHLFACYFSHWMLTHCVAVRYADHSSVHPSARDYPIDLCFSWLLHYCNYPLSPVTVCVALCVCLISFPFRHGTD